MSEDLSKIGNAIVAGSLDEALGMMHDVAIRENRSDILQETDAMASTYGYMKQYMLNPVDDAHRDEIYNGLRIKAYETLAKLRSVVFVRDNATLASAWKHSLAHPVDLDEAGAKFDRIAQDLAISSLSGNDESKTRSLHQQLFDCRQSVFNSLVIPFPLTQANVQSLEKILLSPYTDAANGRIIISALLLAQYFVFDIWRFKLLATIYCESTNDDLRQYALVAMVLGRPGRKSGEMYRKELNDIFIRLSEVPTVKEDLAELQMQMLLCLDTEEAGRIIENEIMPSFKASAKQFDGKKSEKEMLDELLRPDADDQRMEKVEKGVERLREMQKSGADIFFGGFAKAKRFSFFYTLVNWFTPFYVEHPQITSLHSGNVSKDAISILVNSQPFCNSDKYSFILAFSAVSSQLPKEVIEVISRGETIASELKKQLPEGPSFTRLIYLQDLYRFHKLFSSKSDFHDPFASDMSLTFFNWDMMATLLADTGYPLKIARQLLHRNCFSSLDILLDIYKNELDISWLKVKALSEYKQSHYRSSLYWFERAQMIEPDNQLLLKRMADAAYKAEDFAKATKLYNDYLANAAEADNTDEEYYRLALCHIEIGQADKAREILFRLYFNHEEDDRYKVSLARIHMMNADYVKAIAMYGNIADGSLDMKDRVLMATAYWLDGKKRQALEEYRKCMSAESLSQSDLYDLMKNEQLKCGFALGDTDMRILVDTICDKTIN